MLDRRTLLFCMASMASSHPAIAGPKRPCIFWFYTSEIDGSKNAPVSEPEFIVASVDIPSHGADARVGEPAELSAWRYRMERNEDLFAAFIAECRERLDRLVDDEKVDPDLVFVGGVSRGAYAALMLSIADPRFKHVVCLAPVLDLNALTEFEGFNAPTPILDGAELLKGRSFFIAIEEGDTRVGAGNVVEFERRMRSVSPDTEIEAILLPGSDHTVTDEMTGLAVQWINSRIKH